MLAPWTRRRVESELTVSFLAAAAPFVARGRRSLQGHVCAVQEQGAEKAHGAKCSHVSVRCAGSRMRPPYTVRTLPSF